MNHDELIEFLKDNLSIDITCLRSSFSDTVRVHVELRLKHDTIAEARDEFNVGCDGSSRDY